MNAYFDCFSGLAGDMIVAALLDCGADEKEFRNLLAAMDLHDYHTDIKRVERHGISALTFNVHTGHHHHHHHRGLSEIVEIIRKSSLPETVKTNACDVFTRLGRAEAKVHNRDIEQIHFHEVGAVDSIVDIVGACICLYLLNIDKIYFPSIPLGTGTIKAAHGVLPVPAPATAELVKGFKCSQDGQGELTTPTGAALITTLGTQVTAMPELTANNTGYGAGTREHEDRPNLLRVITGSKSEPDQTDKDSVTVLTANIDDMTGEQSADLCGQLMAGGALDVSFLPITMKKGRPGLQLEIICRPADAQPMAELTFEHSSTFGLRSQTVNRYKLTREFLTVKVAGENVNVKIGKYKGKTVQVKPEYEDCRKIADQNDMTLQQVVTLARTAAMNINLNEKEK